MKKIVILSLLLFPCVAWAQSPIGAFSIKNPGFLGNVPRISFPTTNLYFWGDVTDPGSVTIVSGKVSQIYDKSGNGNHLVQATAGSRPTYTASGGPNSLGYCYLGGASIGKAVTYTGVITLYMFIKQPGFSSGAVLFRYKDGGGAGIFGVLNNTASGTNNLSMYAGAAVLPDAPYGYRINQWKLVRAQFLGSSALRLTIDDEPVLQSTVSYSQTPAQIVLDVLQFQNNMYMAEAMVYKGVLSNADDLALKDYFKTKYATSPSTYLLFFGDSHTFGLNASGASTYVKLVEAETGYPAYNQAVSGSVVFAINPYNGMTGQNLSNIYTTNLVHTHGYVIFQYGTNDGTSGVNATWKTNYKSYIQAYIDAGVPLSKIIICSPPYNTNATYATNVANTRTTIAAIATEMGIKYADFYGAMVTAGQDINAIGGDGIHGNNAIHRTLADCLKLQL